MSNSQDSYGECLPNNWKSNLISDIEKLMLQVLLQHMPEYLYDKSDPLSYECTVVLNLSVRIGSGFTIVNDKLSLNSLRVCVYFSLNLTNNREL